MNGDADKVKSVASIKGVVIQIVEDDQTQEQAMDFVMS